MTDKTRATDESDYGVKDPWSTVQTTLTDTLQSETPERPVERRERSDAQRYYLHDPDAPVEAVEALRQATQPCPWCLAPPELFRYNTANGWVGCSNCDTSIPYEQDWYQEGDAIVTPREADRMGHIDRARRRMAERERTD